MRFLVRTRSSGRAVQRDLLSNAFEKSLTGKRVEPLEAGFVIVEIVLPGLESEVFSGGDVLGEVVEVGGLGGVELVGLDGFLVEVGVRFNGSDFLGKMVMMKERKAFVFF